MQSIYKELNAVLLPSGNLELEWSELSEPIGKDQQILQDELFRRFKEDEALFGLYLGFSDPSVSLSVSLDFWRRVCVCFAEQLVRTPELEELRHKVTVPLDEEQAVELVRAAPFMPGSEYLTIEVLDRIWSELNTTTQRQIKSNKGTVAEYIQALSPKVHLVGRVFFHLVESKKDEYPFAFLATYSTGLNQKGQSKHLPLKHALAEYGANSHKLLDLLGTVHLAAKESAFIREVLDSGEIFHPLALSAGEAYAILKEIPLYERCGILCRIPNWWKNKQTGLRIAVNIGDDSPVSLGMDAVLDFDARLILGDTALSQEELRTLLAETEGLAFLKGKWVEVDREKLEQTLKAYERARELMDQDNLTLRDAMRLQLGADRDTSLGQEGVDIEFTHGQWLRGVTAKLSQMTRLESVRVPKGFKASLRPYQQTGLDWLRFLNTLQLGACLADDMGLGKTIQMLALLSSLKSKAGRQKKRAALLVLPASLIGNWTAEIDRFAPTLHYLVAHPSAGVASKQKRTTSELNRLDLVITTYALCQRYTWLKPYDWDLVILDEAQAIKNPGTKQTRAVKQLKAKHRIVMTGTPVENRLSDLWSLFDFLNPGLLGTAKAFAKFTKTLRQDPGGYARLKQVVSPYILRRLKTDKSVISDLPDKVEMKTYAQLTKKQIVLYQGLVQQLKDSLQENPDGMRRKGLVLAALMKFKQLANHPDQYLGQHEYGADHSGKFLRLRSICETIHDKRERVLIFTQFKEIIEPLHDYLSTVFGQTGLILHGGTPVKKRKQIVERFQGHDYIPFMVLSIKAGGVGLNLTAANHVIHFDRWWNPAVENQATDRAFRIGQHKNVVVHKFITEGTIEEKIDTLLEAKAELSRRIIPEAGETWVTEMNDKELMDLFTLSL